jgi:hypothetical protein
MKVVIIMPEGYSALLRILSGQSTYVGTYAYYQDTLYVELLKH